MYDKPHGTTPPTSLTPRERFTGNVVTEPAYTKAVKGSEDDTVDAVNTHGYYGLDGAYIAVYRDRGCTSLLRLIDKSTDEHGTVTAILPYGTYYAKELTPSRNHEVSHEVIGFTIGRGKSAEVTFTQMPVMSMLSLKAMSADEETTVTNANYNLNGAQYGIYPTAEKALAANAKAVSAVERADEAADASDDVLVAPTGEYDGRQEAGRDAALLAGDGAVRRRASVTREGSPLSAMSTLWEDTHSRSNGHILIGDWYASQTSRGTSFGYGIADASGADKATGDDKALIVRHTLADIGETRANGQTVAEIGGYRYILPDTGATVWVARVREGGVELPVAISDDPDAVRMRV